MAFQPASNLANRSFVGLIIAQFLAGFNDQAIHASAMFYVIHHGLTQAQAITLMPILFYTPWALFCTLSGYYADRYSKTYSLIIWKVAEIGISLVMLLGFYLHNQHGVVAGTWLVMSAVFLMGTHAAFFAPAKYGAMPEILQPHVLSRGNGILESTTFLAAIFGTVSGGLLYKVFQGQEEWIAVTLVGLSVIGAFASFMIAVLPAGNPQRLFPYNLFKPLWTNLRALFHARPLALSVLGIAFFVFMVSYMRAAVYMHGETRNPRWDEFHTSLIVATVALGVGLGSPLAGYLSGGKVELGLVPLGCLGMIAATLGAGLAIELNAALIAALIVIGFFSGFYMVPLYTLLQHRAPQTGRGDLIATSNFINVTGAIAASLLFGFLVFASQRTGITPEVKVTDKLTQGQLKEIQRDPLHPTKIKEIFIDNKGVVVRLRAKTQIKKLEINESADAIDILEQGIAELEIIEFDENFLEFLGSSVNEGDSVIVATYELRGRKHYLVRSDIQPLKPIYDTEVLPRFLFLGASVMTLGILFLLWWKLPDFFTRSFFMLRSLGRYEVRAVQSYNLPTYGPVILATNAHTLDASLQLVSATDRSTKVVLVEESGMRDSSLMRILARGSNLIELRGSESIAHEVWDQALRRSLEVLAHGHLLAVSVDTDLHAGEIEEFLKQLRERCQAPIIPVFCGPRDQEPNSGTQRIRVIFGEAYTGLPLLTDLRASIQQLAKNSMSSSI